MPAPFGEVGARRGCPEQVCRCVVGALCPCGGGWCRGTREPCGCCPDTARYGGIPRASGVVARCRPRAEAPRGGLGSIATSWIPPRVRAAAHPGEDLSFVQRRHRARPLAQVQPSLCRFTLAHPTHICTCLDTPNTPIRSTEVGIFDATLHLSVSKLAHLACPRTSTHCRSAQPHNALTPMACAPSPYPKAQCCKAQECLHTCARRQH